MSQSKQPRTILLQVSNWGFHFNPREGVPMSATNLPADSFRFQERRVIYWEVDMLGYDHSRGRLEVRVREFAADDPEAFRRQQAKYPVRELHFRPLDWTAFRDQLSFYRREALEALIAEAPPETGRAAHPAGPTGAAWEETRRTQRLHVSVTLSECTFGLGRVVFEKRPPGLTETLRFEIRNPVILPEFDYIKGFFAKALGRRRIAVEAVVVFAGEQAVEIHAASADIARISEELISTVRYLHARQLTQPPPEGIAVDKSLFTAGEAFSQHGKADWGNVFQPEDILRALAAGEGIRNRPQLEFLAGRVQSPAEPLRFTLYPSFGFLFFAEGERMDHFIWELLDSHATYLWSFDRARHNRQGQYRIVEDIIQFIRDQGRNAYRRQAAQPDVFFQSIRHEKAGSALVDGFPRWRSRLLEKLI